MRPEYRYRLLQKMYTGRKNGFTERQRWSQTGDKGHLCTTLTRDKCLPLPAVKGESSGDKGRFCHAFNPYLWRSSKVYFISICTPIKGVVKYVWDSGQRCDKSAAKLCLWLKSKACEKCGQMCLSLRSNVWQSCRQMRQKFKAKVLQRCCQICLVFFLPSHRASRSSRASREFRFRRALRANAALLPR